MKHRVAVLILTGFLVLWHLGYGLGAPAPLLKRESNDPPSPARLKWAGMLYDAEFVKGGDWKCRPSGGTGSLFYEGSWSCDGKVLVIHERAITSYDKGGGTVNSWQLYRVALRERWVGTLEPPHGPIEITITPLIPKR